MSSRAHVQIDADTIEEIAFRHGLHIERSADEERMYVLLDGVCFWAPSPDVSEEVPC